MQLSLVEQASDYIEQLIATEGEEMFFRGMKVWVAVNGTQSPGVVIDPERRSRQVITRNGPLTLVDSVEIGSLRKVPTQDAPFMTCRPESTAFVTLRADYIPAVDGPEGADVEKVIEAIQVASAQSLLDLQKRRAAAAGRAVNQVDWQKVGKTALQI